MSPDRWFSLRKDCKCNEKGENHRNHIRIFNLGNQLVITIHHELSGMPHTSFIPISQKLAAELNEYLKKQRPDCLMRKLIN